MVAFMCIGSGIAVSLMVPGAGFVGGILLGFGIAHIGRMGGR